MNESAVIADYFYTTVRELDRVEFDELRALVLRALPTLTWRHHAIGALQGYVLEDREPEVRVHIWHPDLVRVDPVHDAGRPHDHRFALCSTILAGSIGHEELHVVPEDRWPEEKFDPQAQWTSELAEYTVQHARKGAAPLVPTGRKLRAHRTSGVIPAQCRYTFPSREYHRSFVPEPAVTLVTKVNQQPEPARVLFPAGVEPTFGVHPFDEKLAVHYVSTAMKMLAS